jgi:hypothetical protein
MKLDRITKYGSWSAGIGLLACTLGTGCGMVGEMVKDPFSAGATIKVSQEAVPLAVVVRRADAASTTASEVNRLLTATPVDATSTWPQKTQISQDDVTATQKELADHPYYDHSTWSILPAEVWVTSLTAIKSDSGQSPSLLAAISPDLGDAYAKIGASIDAEAALEQQKKTEEDARDAKGVSDADKKAHQAAADALNVQIDAAKKNIDETRKAFMASCQAAAAKVPAATRDQFAPVVVNLRRAVHEAKVANTAATVRYPMLVVQTVQSPSGLKDELISVAKGSVSDIVFEHTGKRIKLQASAQFQVVYDNGKVDLSMNGVTTSDLESLSVSDVVTETIVRTGHFAIEALTLPAIVVATQEKLDFEADVLDGIKDGFRSSGGNIPAPVEVSIKTSVEIRAGGKASTGGSNPLAMNPFSK